MLLRTKLSTLAVACCGLALGACSSATMHDSPSGAYVTDGAWVKSVENATITDVYQAAETALRDLDMEVQKREQRALDSRLVAEEVDGTNITVDLQKLNDESTRLAIKVGAFGSDTVATMVLDKIRENLGGTAQGPETTGRTTPAGFRENDRDEERQRLEEQRRQQERNRDLEDQRDTDVDIDVEDRDDDDAWLSEPPADRDGRP